MRLKILYPLLLFLTMMVVGCRSPKEIIDHHESDSVRVEVKEVYIERIDTIPITIEKEVVKTIADTFSFLESKYSISEAYVDSLGRLNHILETKEQTINVPSKSTLTSNDTIYIKEKGEIHTEYVEVEVNKYPLLPFGIAIIVVVVIMIVVRYVIRR